MYFRDRFAEDNRIGCRDRVRGFAGSGEMIAQQLSVRFRLVGLQLFRLAYVPENPAHFLDH
jgi:hypothetical protein